MCIYLNTVSFAPDHFPLGRFQVQYGPSHSPGKPKQSSSSKRKGSPVVGVGSKLHRKTSDVDCVRKRGMANKENELTCSDDVRGMHYNDNCGLPVNSAEASKMAGASSKYSDFTEVRWLFKLVRWYGLIKQSDWFSLVLCTADKGPWSYDSRPLWEKSTTKSGTNSMAEKRQWVSGIPYKVKF